MSESREPEPLFPGVKWERAGYHLGISEYECVIGGITYEIAQDGDGQWQYVDTDGRIRISSHDTAIASLRAQVRANVTDAVKAVGTEWLPVADDDDGLGVYLFSEDCAPTHRLAVAGHLLTPGEP